MLCNSFLYTNNIQKYYSVSRCVISIIIVIAPTATIYTKQQTREWGDPYLTWWCANVLLRLYKSERSNVLLLNMYESLWVSVRVVERGSVIEVAEGVRVVEVLWFKLLKVWELCSVKIFSASESSVRAFYC